MNSIINQKKINNLTFILFEYDFKYHLKVEKGNIYTKEVLLLEANIPLNIEDKKALKKYMSKKNLLTIWRMYGINEDTYDYEREM